MLIQSNIYILQVTLITVDDFIDGEYADGVDDESEGLRSAPPWTPAVNNSTHVAVNRRVQGYFANQVDVDEIGMRG